MIETILKTINDLAANIVVASFVAVSGLLVGQSWRKHPLIPASAVIFGPVVGYFGHELGEAFGGPDMGSWVSILFTTIGTLVGPTAITYLQDRKAFLEIMEVVKEKMSK